MERGGVLNVRFEPHFDIIVRVIDAEVFSAKDLNGMSDTFVELTMAGRAFRTRVKFEDRAPTFRDEFRFSLSEANVKRPGALTLRLGVYDMDISLFNTKGVTTDIVGLNEVDISSALKTPRRPVTFKTDVGVGNVMDGRVTLEVISEYLTSPREVVIHEARYGFVDPAPTRDGSAPKFAPLFSAPSHTGQYATYRTPNDPPATWRDVTDLVRGVLLDNKLVIDPQGDTAYLRNMFWPDAPHVTKPGCRRGLAVRYSIGGASAEIVTLFDEPREADGDLAAIDVKPPPSKQELQDLHTSMIESAEDRAETAMKAAAVMEEEVRRLHEEREKADQALAEARAQHAAANDEAAAKAQLRIAELQQQEEAAKTAAAEARRNAMLAKAAAAAAAGQTAAAARDNASAQADEADRLQRLREQFEAEAKAADEARARRAKEDEAAEERRVARLREQQELETKIAQMKAEANGRQQLLEEKKRLEEEARAAEQVREELRMQQRQASILQQRIETLRKQELESAKRAEQAQKEAERRQKEAAEKAAVAQKLAASRVTPAYWTADADDHGLRKIELSSDAVWRERFQNLLDDTCRRATLGAGRDQIIKSGKYDRLLFHRAWRLENSKLYSLYAAHRDSQIGTPNERAVAKTHQVASSRWIADLGLREKERNELLLWHGTKPDVVDLIATDGFDERLCKLSGLFGAGVYFADEVSKSDQYVTPTPPNDPKNGVYHILLVRVTMGNFANLTTGTKDARRAPAGCHSIIGQIDRNKYREFVTYDGWLAYPEFLIQYKRQYK
uniref:Poly [ADP-ribose] polymerase n=1 Tax=Neobodo designis TaxID=312471 RepID=A0A7S1W2A3_NEODS